MKKLTALLTLVLAVVLVTRSHAQLSKDEAKEWKNKAKEYKKNPAELKQLVEDKQNAEAEVSTLKTEKTSLESRLSDQNAKVSELQDDLSKLRSDLASARAELNAAKASPSSASSAGGKMVDGVVFKVQVGAFRNKDLSKYFDNNENFSGENEDGMQKITLGQFRDYWEADTFKKYLREMGVKDAWIVPYKDGTRVDIKDVLEGVIASDGPSDSE
ncbi:SPOR domain-containing protein [Fulvivirga ligni]|uniref:SPOR domain-containing protein n=1 Tax=Fulvivirga ligni TaxID=2904246 RepID=UPI001F357B47|nr:SPOR domain-containing protein [Fulvivirga ligni]UII22096.1 Ezrin/radixin/moesin family protein [Fulvivirga ligni]